MKHVYLRLTLAILLLLKFGTASAQLTAACSPTYPSGSASWYITSFTLGSFTHSPASATHNYTALSFTLNAGSTYAITAASLGFCCVQVCVDFNNNGVLDDPGEFLAYPSYIATSPATYNFNITIPPYILSGSYRFRIMNRGANSGNGTPAGSACGTYGYGSWVDYTVNVVNTATCLPPSGLAVTNVLPASADLSWNASTSTPNGYTWKVVNQGLDPNLVPGISGYTSGLIATVSGLTSLTAYQLYVQSDCGGAGTSLWSLAQSFNTPCSALPTPGSAATANATPCLSQTVSYSLTGASAGTGITYQWEDSLATGNTWTQVAGATTSTSSFALNTSGVHYLRAAVSCGALTSYSTPVVATISAFPGGTYTIDATAPTTYPSGTNFISFSAAVSAISCGITGPVVFNIAPSATPYNEQVTIPAVGNTSIINTVTFNGNGDTLVYNATASGSPWTLCLNGSDNFIFNNLVVKGTNGTYALSCHLWNQADNNAFNNCTFMAPANCTLTTQVPFSLSGSASVATTAGTSGNGNVLTGCTIFSGYYNTVLVGNTGTGINTGNQVINCNLTDFYFYGSYNLYQNGVVVRGNTIERPTRTTLATTFYGVYIGTSCSNSLIENNRIRKPNTTAAASNTTASYGIYRTGAGIIGNDDRFYNNLITDFEGSGTHGGIYLTTATYLKAYHNTIVFDNTAATAGTTYGIYATGTAGNDIKNNIVRITKTGTGAKYCLYFTGAGKTSNNNDLYISAPAGTNYVGYWGTGPVNAATLSAWQAANSAAWDQQSLDVDPLFFNPAANDYTPTNGLLDDMGTPVGVTTDLLNAARSVSTPDIGAYEFSVTACSGTPNPGTATGPSAVCPNIPFTLLVTGTSTGSGLTAQWQVFNTITSLWDPAPGNSTGYAYTSTGISSPSTFRLQLTCSNGGNSAVTNTLSLTVNSFLYCYCIPVSSCTNEGIENVSFATLNNGSAYCATGGYTDYSNLGSLTTVSVSQVVPMTVSARVNSNPASAALWIDYDHSGTFDVAEFTAFANAVGAPLPSTYIFSGNVTIPAAALAGITRMRIRTANQSGLTATSACNTGTVYGEYEDYLVTISTSPLAISLTSISAANAGARNRVDWTTGSEANGDYFIIERSADNRSFTTLGSVTPKGSATTYSYWDESPVNGVNYYRLKMMDAAGKGNYSETVTATAKAGKFSVTAYPNPVSETLTIKVYGNTGDNATVTITDATGRLVKAMTIVNNEAIVNMSGLAQGMYLIKYTDNRHSEILKVSRK